MIIGDLGNLEIVLVACDDGDVLAFYVKGISWEMATSSPVPEDRARVSNVLP